MYKQVAEATDDKDAIKVLEDVIDEEKVHAGEFLELLYRIAPDEKKYYEEGINEVREMIGGEIKMATNELKFASEDEALQYLANFLGQKILVAKKWSGKIKPHWSPPEGFFTQSASAIADGLHGASKDLKQAMGRLTCFINRAGDNLTGKDKDRLERAKDMLRKKFESKEE
jgi:rubrerythrin